jgi:predicted RNA-binding protein with RPS1 domain
MLIDVETSNKLSLTMKEQQKLKEKEEDMAIMRYNQQRQLAEYERQEQERRIKEEKEKELQKLREQQEKAADRQAEIDAIRAKRAYEAQER